MGFFDWISGLFPRQKKQKPRRQALAIDALENELSAVSSAAGVELQKKAVVKFSEIKHLLREIESELAEIEKINSETDEGNPKLRRMAATAKQNFVVQIQSMAGKLRPPAADLGAIRTYCATSIPLLQNEILKSRKSIVLAGFAARGPVKRIGSHMNELVQTLTGLSNELNANKNAFAASDLKNSLSKFKALVEKQREAESEIEKINSRKGSLSAERVEMEKTAARLASSGEYAEFAELKQKLDEIEKEKSGINSLLVSKISEVDKPLGRLLKLSESGRVALSSEERAILQNYLSVPLVAIKQDPKAEVLKRILQLQAGLIADSTISLKDKENERYLAATSSLREFDFFTNIFWKLNDADARRLALEKKVSFLEITKKISKANSGISALSRSAEEAEKELASKQAELKKTRAEIEESAKGLSASASAILGRETELVL